MAQKRVDPRVHRSPFGFCLWFGVATVLAFGCGGSAASSRACTPGASVACTCTSGETGAQVCSSDGFRYEACLCGNLTGSGGAASGGSVGTGGRSGSGSGGAGVGGSSGEGGNGSIGSGGQRPDTGPLPSDAAVLMDGGISNTIDGGYSGRWVTVQVLDAIIAPGKADGTAWDGTVTIPNDVLQEVGDALAGGDPVGGVLAVLAGPDLNTAISSLDKPDPYGTAQANVFGTVGQA